jgi:DNA (cytosine-5)-methyltransferase 1
MKVASLFAGIGGFDLGLQRAGMSIELVCEIDPAC